MTTTQKRKSNKVWANHQRRRRRKLQEVDIINQLDDIVNLGIFNQKNEQLFHHFIIFIHKTI